MTFFLGTKGNVRLRRGNDTAVGRLAASIDPEDVNTGVNRFSFDGATDNLLTGDRVDIATSDDRGIDFVPASHWSTNNTEDDISAFVNIDQADGVRLYPTFADAVNDTTANQISLEAFAGDPLDVTVTVRDLAYNILGNVTRYEFQNSRERIETTSLSDKYKQQYSAGILSGSGRIDCAFDYTSSATQETPKLLLQLIQRLDLGCAFDLALYLTDQSVDLSVENIFYMLTAVVTNAGVTVEAGEIINCSIDFVTTGRVQLILDRPSRYLLKEDTDKIGVEHSVDFLLR